MSQVCVQVENRWRRGWLDRDAGGARVTSGRTACTAKSPKPEDRGESREELSKDQIHNQCVIVASGMFPRRMDCHSLKIHAVDVYL